jgi:hypothetical protein
VEIGEVIYPRNRPEWRSWLEENGSSATEIWVRRLREDKSVWASFSHVPVLYQRLKIGWITEAGQLRREEMEKRLGYLIKNTRAGKM